MIKSIAEWSEQEYLLLALPHKNTDWKIYLDEILTSYHDFVKAVIPFQKVLLIAPNDDDFSPFKDYQNVEFFKCDTNDTWIRDYGAIDIFKNDKLQALNFTFNAWGNKYESSLDNEVNEKLFSLKFKENLQNLDFILEGGSIDFNGKGVMLTTTTCLLNDNRNKLSKEILDKKLKEIFGLKDIIWLENGFIKGDDTDSHVDTLARFIDENTIAYSICEDKNDENYECLKAMEKELLKINFNLLPLPLPKPIYYKEKRLGATYANFVFVNNALIVPVYDDKNDELVMQNLQKALPTKKIIPVNAKVFIRENGSLHCSCQNRYKGKR